MNKAPERLLYRTEEAAAILGLGITTTKNLIRTGELRSVKIRNCRRIMAASLQEYTQRLDFEQNTIE